MEADVKRTWMPTVAGILDIISAALKLLTVFGLVIGIAALEANPYIDITDLSGGVPLSITAMLWTLAASSTVFGMLALVGGIYALKRKKWSLALAGSVAALLPTGVLGIIAIILVALSKDEFE